MRRLIFTPEHDQFRDSVRRFFEREVAPHGERWREQGYVDREIYLKAGAQGLLLTWAEERFGGLGLTDFRFEQIIIEENIAHGEIGFYINLHSNLVAPYIAELGSEEQQQRILPGAISGETILAIAMTEPAAGSDLAGMRTRAEDKGDHWLLNGSKTYISNGQLADVVVVAARTDPDSRHGLGLFLVEAGMPGFERGKRLRKLGMHAQDTSELFFADVKLPKQNILGEAGQGFRYLAKFLAGERLVAAIGSMAAAQIAFDITLDFVKERRAFGKPIGAFQNSRFVLAGLRTELDAVQTFIDQCVLLYNDRELSAEVAAECKLAASELEGKVTDACLQLHGGAGYMDEYRISRLYADARVTRIFAGSSEIMKEIIGRGLGLDERKLT
jgi:acyl-CoA dehydrogenase